jgi:hypothetical protein
VTESDAFSTSPPPAADGPAESEVFLSQVRRGHILPLIGGVVDAGYFPLKLTNDGTPNPRIYAGNPVLIASYVIGAFRASQSSGG